MMTTQVQQLSELLILILDLLIILGTVVAVRDVWFKGSIEPFATWKAHTELWDNWAGPLLSCSLCLTYHLPWLLLLLYYLPGYYVGDWYKWIFYSLAITGYANRLKVWKEETYG